MSTNHEPDTTFSHWEQLKYRCNSLTSQDNCNPVAEIAINTSTFYTTENMRNKVREGQAMGGGCTEKEESVSALGVADSGIREVTCDGGFEG